MSINELLIAVGEAPVKPMLLTPAPARTISRHSSLPRQRADDQSVNRMGSKSRSHTPDGGGHSSLSAWNRFETT